MSFFYQQIVVLELYKFLLQKEKVTSIPNKESLKDYIYEIAIELNESCILIPILKNNDPTSPVWAFKAKQLYLKPIQVSQPMNLEVVLNGFNLEVKSYSNS
jgi:hypothetical protein